MIKNKPQQNNCWGLFFAETILRKLRDSNSWYGCPYVSLANWWFQPLTQTSILRFCGCKYRKEISILKTIFQSTITKKQFNI